MDQGSRVLFAVDVTVREPDGCVNVRLLSGSRLYGGVVQEGWASTGGFSIESLREMRETIWAIIGEAVDGEVGLPL